VIVIHHGETAAELEASEISEARLYKELAA
jgi:hypothetical protein